MRYGLIRPRMRVLRVIVGSFVLAFALLLALSAVASAQSFSDVRGDEWFAEAVDALAAEGIVSGRDDGSFGPSDPVTRAQLAALLARTLDLQDFPYTPFIDVTTQDWFSGPVGALYQTGIVSGTGPITFSPQLPVSRQQAATLVMRALSYTQESEPPAEGDHVLPPGTADLWLAGFRDRALIGPEHSESVANAYRLGIIEGAPDGWFYPSLTLTRAQMAAVLYRAFLQPVVAKNTYPVELEALSYYPAQSVGSEGPLGVVPGVPAHGSLLPLRTGRRRLRLPYQGRRDGLREGGTAQPGRQRRAGGLAASLQRPDPHAASGGGR